MSLATLSDVLQPALKGGYAVGGLVTLGWEEMRAYVAAAEAENVPVILQAGPGCREYTPLPVLAAMFRTLAEWASVPVVAIVATGAPACEPRERSRDDDDDDAAGDAGTPRLDAGRPGRFEESFHVR